MPYAEAYGCRRESPPLLGWLGWDWLDVRVGKHSTWSGMTLPDRAGFRLQYESSRQIVVAEV
jgi:hypothetical protein